MTVVVVLGRTGMLGSMVFDVLSANPKLEVYGTARKRDELDDRTFFLDAEEFGKFEKVLPADLGVDYYVNCIGVTKPFCRDDDAAGVQRAIRVNAEFPWNLGRFAKASSAKVIQIGTDCVYSGKRGAYVESDPHDPLDVYGKTKSLGEPFDGSTLIVRSSIIGPERRRPPSFLLEWFISQPDGGTIGGFEHHVWNGVTTLQFARLCERIIVDDLYDELMEVSHVHHYVPNETVTKYQLMRVFDEVFSKGLEINKVNRPEERVDRSLATEFDVLSKLGTGRSMLEAIKELKDYMDAHEKGRR